jgi:ribosome maturation factor RimP
MGWSQPIFFCVSGFVPAMRNRPQRSNDDVPMGKQLGELLEQTVPALGYELVAWEIAGKGPLVRVFIDKPEGVVVDDCARVSDQLTHLFTVENVEYGRLEVSSPGVDRPLTKLADFTRFAGEEAQINLRDLTDGTRKLKGIVRGVDGDNVLLEGPQGVRAIPITTIARARLVPKIEWRKTK